MPHTTINGARLWYEERGSGEPILLHHGYTASRVNWMPVAERLQDRYRVILMECRGTGDSEHTEDGYTLEQYAADVIGVLDHLGIERVTYAGHSMGGGIGYVLAIEYPERLERLVLMAAVPADGLAEGDPVARAERRAERKRGDREVLIHRYRAGRFRADVQTDEWFEDRVDHLLGVSDGHYDGSGDAMRALAVGDRLGEIATPTLVIAGSIDALLPSNLRDFRRLPNAALEVFSRAGHEVAVHEPAGVADAITAFMEHGVVTSQQLAERVATAEAAATR